MKPRLRTEQKQTSRMYFRKHDHRDIIFDDAYSNAMWCNTEDIEDVLTWVKYPKMASMSAYSGFMGWMDIDRQFSFGINAGGGSRTVTMYKLNNGLSIVQDAYTNVGNSKVYVTKDGIVWNDITSQLSFLLPTSNAYYMDNDTIVEVWTSNPNQGGDGKTHINVTIINFDEESEEFVVEQSSSALDCDTSWISWITPLYFMGTEEDGMIVARQYILYYTCQLFVYKIDRDGHVERRSADVPTITSIPMFNPSDKTTWTQKEDMLFVATSIRYSGDQGRNWDSSVRAFVSSDGGETWNETTFLSGRNLSDLDSSYHSAHRIELFQRDGKVYLLFGQACDINGSGWHEVHLYETEDGLQWNEIVLPKWVDIPVLNVSSGQGVSPAVNDTIRVAIRPNETTSQDYNMFDLLSENRSAVGRCMDIDHGNILFQDGELKDLVDTDFYMVIGSGNLRLYFDNIYMAENAKAFAWFTATYDSNLDGADYIQQNDYCVRGE